MRYICSPEIIDWKSDELLNGLGCILNSEGNRHGDLGGVVLGNLGKIGEELVEGGEIVTADLQGAVDEQVGHVAVSCDDTCHHAAQSGRIVDKIIVCIDEAYLVVDVGAKLSALLQANDVALGLVERSICGLDEGLSLAGSLDAD